MAHSKSLSRVRPIRPLETAGPPVAGSTIGKYTFRRDDDKDDVSDASPSPLVGMDVCVITNHDATNLVKVLINDSGGTVSVSNWDCIIPTESSVDVAALFGARVTHVQIFLDTGFTSAVIGTGFDIRGTRAGQVVYDDGTVAPD